MLRIYTSRIMSTYDKFCTDCRKPVPITSMFLRGTQLTVVTECKKCSIRYTTTFLFEGGENPVVGRVSIDAADPIDPM